MKLHLKITIVFCVIIVLSAVLIITQKNNYPDVNYNSEKIQKVHIVIDPPISGNYYTNEFDVTSESGINTEILFIKQMKDNEKKSIGMEVNSLKYTFVYTFKNGTTKSIEHIFKPSTSISAMSDLFSLDEVIKQINPIFHVKDTDISKASINYYPADSEFLQNDITNEEDIKYLLDIAKEDVLLNKNNTGESRCGITFLGENNEDVLCSFNINNNTYKLNEMRQKIPEINEIVAIAEKNLYQ